MYTYLREKLVYVETTSSTSNTPLVNLQKVPQLTGDFEFALLTNDLVKLRVEVWDDDGRSEVAQGQILGVHRK